MSLLPDDELSTLEAALAFIDTYHDKGEALESSSASSSCSLGDAAATSTSGSDSANDDSESSPKHVGSDDAAVKRKARNAQASARSHRKKRAELLLLREEEGVLQAQLDALKARKVERQRRSGQHGALSEWDSINWGEGDRSSAFGAAVAISSAHYDHALHQRRLRQKSEALNRQLRAALRKQRSLTDHFSQLIQKRLVVKEVSDLLDTTEMPWSPFASPCYAPLTANSDGSRITHEKMAILEDLESKMQALFLESDFAIASIESESSSSNTHIKQHPEYGACVEMSSSIPLPCSLEDAWQLFSEALCNMKAHHSSSYTFTMRPISDDSSEKEYSLAFEDKARLGVVPVDGVTFLQKFRTKHYASYLWESMIRPRAAGIQFRESGWVAVSRSPVDPKNRCVYQQRYQLFAEMPSEPSTTHASQAWAQLPNESLPYVKQFLLNSLAAKMRNDQRKLEDAMRCKFGDSVPLVPAI